LLAHACVQSGNLPRARDLYQKLATMEPQNPLHMANYQQVVAQLGGTTAGVNLITPEEAAVIVDELEATAPPVHQHYSDEVALAVRSALTDAELFISYNIPAKALGPLLAVLPQAPNDLRLNQRLAALHTRTGRFAEAAVCCHTLQNIYSDAGYPEEATGYGELAERYEQRSSTSTAAVAEDVSVMEITPEGTPLAQAAAVPWPAFAPAPVHEGAHASSGAETEFAVVAEPREPSNESAPAVEELDLFSEWEDSVTVEEDPPAAEIAAVEISDAVGDHDLPAADARPETNDEKSEETVEEVRFYLGHGMSEQASAAFAKLQTLTHDRALLATLRAEIEAASQAPAGEEEFSVPDSIEEIAAEDIPSADLREEEITVSIEDTPASEVTPSALEPAPEVAASAAEVAPEVTVEQPGVLKEFVADLESSLGDTFLPGAVEHDAEATAADQHQMQPRANTIEPHIEPAAPVEHHSAEAPALGELVADLEASLGDDFLKGAPVAEPEAVSAVAPQAPPPAAPPPAAPPAVAPPASAPMAAAAAAGTTPARARTVPPPKPSAAYSMPVGAAKSSPFAEDAGVDLAEMFGELKQDLEADLASADEDPETHYNLGIAFREMGLLDEAIGELQKACQSVERGHAFSQIMQTYTWLAQCFLDKGVPEAAIRWYDKALSVPSIDGDTRVALHYELGAAYETSGDKPSALKHFTQVYGSNIDYRDVAERIKALKS
jgi:tetratricopeptide (TPR) repeat protein